jgi:hypothetical protein
MKLNSLRIPLIVFFLFASTSILWAQFEPKAVIHPMTYDYGKIVQDSVVTTIFVITNEGNDILKINDVKTSCGCTAVVVGENELKPGESTEIEVSFDSKGRTGKQNKTITVSTNDPDNSIIKLTFTGNVIKKEKAK